MLKGAAIVLLAVGAFTPLAWWIQHHFAGVVSDPSVAASLFAVPQECRPEPAERLIYLSSLIFLPLCIFGVSHYRPGLVLPEWCESRWLRWPMAFTLVGGLICLGAIAASGDKDDLGHGYYHIRFQFFREHPLFLALLPLLTLGVGRAKPPSAQSSRWFWPLLLTICLAPLLGSVFSSHWAYAGQWHFNAVFDSSVRLSLGKTLLVDSTSQYGLYAWFLRPLFRCLGLSVVKFTLVMGLLAAGSYFSIGVFLERVVRRPVLAAIGIVATLFNGWMLFLTVEGPHRGSYFDLYFQYVPLRLVFPALMLGLASEWLRRPTRVLSCAIWMLLACGLLWNLDSGAPAVAAWALLQLYVETESGRSAGRVCRLVQQAAIGLVAIAGILATHAVSTYVSAKVWPDYSLLFRSQAIFYAHGFGMMPMPWPGTWMVVIAVYLAGLAYAASAHAGGWGDIRARALFLVSILGLLLFSYYQGRSHRAVLILAWWPAFPALTLLLDAHFDYVIELAARIDPLRLIGLVPAAILIGSVGSYFESLPAVGTNSGNQLAGVLHAQPVPYDRDADILRRQTDRHDSLWIISPRESVLHLATQRPEAARCSFNELLLMTDFPPLVSQLTSATNAEIWIDKAELEAALPVHQGMQLVAGLLASSYEPVAASERGWLFRRRLENRLPKLATTGRSRAGP
jgi:hypothetical protein